MNKWFGPLVLVTGLFFSAFNATAGLVLSFDQPNIEVNLNESFSVDLMVKTEAQVDSIFSWGLDAVFDNGLIQLDSFVLGSNFLPSISPFSDLDGIAGVSANPFGVFGAEILLGTLNFSAIGLGATALNTAHTFTDIFEGFTTLSNPLNPSSFNIAMANISVVQPPIDSAVNAPAAMSLFLVAGLAMLRLRKKR